MQRKKERRLGAVIVAALAAATVVAGCGSDSNSDGEAAKSGAAGISTAKSWSLPAQFIDCDAPTSNPKGCDGEATAGTYTSLPGSEVTKKWNLCVAFPHLKDSYWLATNYGVAEEARRLGVKMELQDAGGYTNLSKQISQLDNCVAQGANATVIGGISFDGLDSKVDEFAGSGIPVVDIMNGISNPKVAAHAVVSFYEIGRVVGQHLVDMGKPVSVAFFPGPPGAGWVEATVKGFNDAIKGSDVKLLGTKYGDTGKDIQLRLVENALQTFPDVQYIVGSAVTAEAAVGSLKERGLADKIKVLSTYMIPETLDKLKAGEIECAATDKPVVQAKIGIDEAVRVLEKKPLEQNAKRAAPAVELFCGPSSSKDNLADFDPTTTFAPTGYKPEFSVG
jgi:protein TorT